MDLSLFLAKSEGIFLTILIAVLFFKQKEFLKMVQRIEEPIIIFIAGILALALGIAQVVGYEVWTFDWKGLITLLGWIALAKGIVLLFFPDQLQSFGLSLLKSSMYKVALIVFGIIGIYLVYAGFSH